MSGKQSVNKEITDIRSKSKPAGGKFCKQRTIAHEIET